jgi:hypothetical protein
MRYILILLFYFGLTVSSANAATVKFYNNDLAGFNLASTTALTDFNDFVCAGAACFSTEFDFDGNTYTNGNRENLLICGPNAFGCLGGPFNSGLMLADDDNGLIRIALAPGRTAIGGLFGDINGPEGTGTLRVYDIDGSLIDTQAVAYGSMAGGSESQRTFFGWTTTDTVFTTLEFTLVGGGSSISENRWSAVDDVRFGQSLSQVPIPASIWLFGTALIGFVGMARRRKVA